MTTLGASGQVAARAKEARRKAEAEITAADAESDPVKKAAALARAVDLMAEAADLEKTARWFSYQDRLDLMGKNKGPQAKTIKRREFLRRIAREIGTKKRQTVCLEAERRPEFWHLFDGYDQAFRFAEPSIFDGI